LPKRCGCTAYFTHQLHGRHYPAVWAPMTEDDD
jgi:hypothetical protein